MNDTTINFYEELKKKRIAKKISLKEISEYTKINNKYLEGIENGDFTLLPNVYTRLFLRSYCNYIGIDYNDILDQYEVYTTGEKSSYKKTQKEFEEKNLDKDTPKNIVTTLDLIKTSKNYKEVAITVIAIMFIIILFLIINMID
ncbi:MAG: hypothetical protein CMG00_06795 [Candidatus Marinimicrobia bacterium]|nr:hypothetical protein [Candidatus Neomarinimicrobiota bacterium]